ncbi:MAG: hypothetical protein DI551_00085 [Micavibrio aeruginosavorus]|uniref:Endonuclease/exonuclease/phosphatase domain-containing protein n=1 Tax=Micavibrio aeruginosavorus TaxID=349221 RepID=A0A2W5N6J1_9BACT|nr:MAG: hypothetical protein DI551_00085 [Micavibrio aeruginosavorus]
MYLLGQGDSFGMRLKSISAKTCKTFGLLSAAFMVCSLSPKTTCNLPALPNKDVDTLRLLSWNVEQLPKPNRLFYPLNTTDCQKRLTAFFDISVLQEAFKNAGLLRGNAGWSASPSFTGPVFNSGLMSKTKFIATNERDRSFGNICYGYALNKNDCLAQKGAQSFEYKGITFVNTHMDSGGNAHDAKARDNQKPIAFSLIPKEGRVVFAGDINIDVNRHVEWTNFKKDLEDRGFEIVQHNGKDILAVRGVHVRRSGVLPANGYSDHDPCLRT